MNKEEKLYQLLNIRRRIERKILLNQKWGIKARVSNYRDMIRYSGSIVPLFLPAHKAYLFINAKIENFLDNNQSFIEESTEVVIKPYNLKEERPIWYSNLKEFDSQLRTVGAFIIIQGSQADGKTTNYSDVDLLIFFDAFDQRVLKLRKEIEIYLLSIDPLQHHGIFMVDKRRFKYYWQFDLPTIVLSCSKHLGDYEETLPIKNIIKEATSYRNSVLSTLLVIENFSKENFSDIGLYRWKLFLSQLMLIPTLLLGTKNKLIYKADSFNEVKDLYSKYAWYCIERASEIRENWIDLNIFKGYSNFRNSCSEALPINKDIVKVHHFADISVLGEDKFFSSLLQLSKETKDLLNDRVS